MTNLLKDHYDISKNVHSAMGEQLLLIELNTHPIGKTQLIVHELGARRWHPISRCSECKENSSRSCFSRKEEDQ